MATEPMSEEVLNKAAAARMGHGKTGAALRGGAAPSPAALHSDPEGELMARSVGAGGGGARPPASAPPDPLPSKPAEAGPSSGFKASAFTPSKFYALDVQELAMDPDIEEAAIRFASGDETSTEQGLLDVLTRKENGGTPDEWMALFDLYRATGRVEAFENRAIDYANRFSRSAPAWYSIPEEVAARSSKSTAAGVDKPRAAWTAEGELDPHMVTMLTKVLERTPQPWVLDWSGLRSVDEAAVPRLFKLFADWARADVELRFVGIRNLRNVLMELAPSGNRTVEQVCWNLHLAALRVLNLPDDFELTALDFCVTFEISPPGWEPPKCQCRDLDAEAAGQAPRLAPAPGRGHADFVPSTGAALAATGRSRIDPNATSSFSFLPPPPAELMGELLGDPQLALARLDEALGDAAVRVVSCRYLIRVDFSAAGAILNWASGHHAQGREIRFVDVHRLISAFFHVIGITEYAKVTTRED
jgi:anti-anti-sigma regulatory factor